MIEGASLYKPDTEEFRAASFESLRQGWHANHARLIGRLRSKPYPFWGLHGTSRRRLEELSSNKTISRNVATSYSKKNLSNFLFQLYSGALYAFNFAGEKPSKQKPNGTDDGAVLVFNLEEGGKNNTRHWEDIKSASLGVLGGYFDPKGKMKGFSVSPSRAIAFFDTPEKFDARYKGNIDVRNFAAYDAPLQTGDVTSVSRNSIRQGFLIQDLAENVLNILDQ